MPDPLNPSRTNIASQPEPVTSTNKPEQASTRLQTRAAQQASSGLLNTYLAPEPARNPQSAATNGTASASANPSTNATTVTTEAKLAAIHFSAKADYISIDSTRYLLTFLTASQRQIAIKAANVLVLNNSALNDLALKNLESNSVISNPSKSRTSSSNTSSTINQQFSSSHLGASMPSAHSQPVTENKQAHQGQRVLLALGSAVTIPLPQQLHKLISQQNVDSQQLQQISARAQGYPLPITQINDGKLQFSNGTLVPLSTLTLNNIASKSELDSAAMSRVYLQPSIQYQNKQWLLTLKPILGEMSVKLVSSSVASQTMTQQDATLVKAKPELSRIYTQLFERLNQTPQHAQNGDSVSDKVAVNQVAINQDSIKKSNAKGEVLSPAVTSPHQALKTEHNSKQQTPSSTQIQSDNSKQHLMQHLMKEYLNKALGKAGSLPKITETANDPIAKPDTSLASAVLKLLPLLRPRALNTLALPSTIKGELAGLMSLQQHIGSQSSLAGTLSPQSHMHSISMLFQLLLGVKSHSASGASKISQQAQNYLQRLQTQMGGSASLLNLLEKIGTTESLGKVFSNLQLYSQASSDSNNQVNWFFTLPYSLNEHQEQLEGHFKQDSNSDEDNESKHWRLQLKFNLGKGPLLIQAAIKGERIDLIFNGTDETLLKKIDSLLPPLLNKLTDIGFQPDKVETKLTNVPATLLPGEHFLVKIKA
ncbi:hypothetical protein FM038_015660 [Shewanella eurypsychrophilus]|uniref:Flagellar hook-length control protein-like C-terminal domain-containing protein n=1 Tax=Shewanella eurypsychrophilus TaxID=2593656 RepID=A0ABX6V9Z9_9GAMM|nr:MULTISPECIES: hypothetical protein [Shewanella]QFU23463.1 hypothetical protein FS418_17465 [Shewanella sp. YLB-09]QPG58691.1 hypothetical protein FM038_015660 [Shewanella eurypsychrophilus]